ncbi:hypothetical protein BJX96DRAFT_174955 [Aspergillus floccosus]
MSSPKDHQCDSSLRRHPRRRAALSTSPPSLLNSSNCRSTDSTASNPLFRKSETFHSAKNRPTPRDPRLSLPLAPRRSPTSPAALEAIAAGKERMSKILDTLDLDTFTPSESVDEELPVPRSVLQLHFESLHISDRPQSPSARSAPPKKPLQRVNHHTSDSGLGTSVCSEEALSATESADMDSNAPMSASQTRKMSPDAIEKIEKRVFYPLLMNEKLDTFHNTVRCAAKAVKDNRFCYLRDVENLFRDPFPIGDHLKYDFSLFLDQVVLCLNDTWHRLDESDRTMPGDVPYSNEYILDLYDQIVRFKALCERAKQNLSDRNDAKSKIPNLVLKGGLAKTGRPAELVAQTDDQMLSLRTGKTYDESNVPSMKRGLSLRSMDAEEAHRSMARRRKDEAPMNINARCPNCSEVFRRPCDLTKHLKTHTRPFKCPEPDCKYHAVGFPTDKERERHYNDRHNPEALPHVCGLEGCTYKSKRLSNLKQHKEKRHGWVYVRTKSNGKGKGKKASPQSTPDTPGLTTPGTSTAQSFSTPNTGPSPSPPQAVSRPLPTAEFNFADPPLPTPVADFQLFNATSPMGGNGGVNMGYPDLGFPEMTPSMEGDVVHMNNFEDMFANINNTYLDGINGGYQVPNGYEAPNIDFSDLGYATAVPPSAIFHEDQFLPETINWEDFSMLNGMDTMSK